MPTIAQQLRTDRHRRARRRRLLVGLVVAAPAAVLIARLVAVTSAGLAGAHPAATITTAAAPSTSAAPTTSSPPSSLHPGLVGAFERANADAADAGHDLTITSGFRTVAEQAALLEDEIDERGSLEEALWWVFPPERSMHVRGLAIDVGDGSAADWLADHGARFGLCRTLAWEWWHFEWRAGWEATGTCPTPAQTPVEAPRP